MSGIAVTAPPSGVLPVAGSYFFEYPKDIRLFAMSFDPYNCVELRWGDDSPACPDQAGKRRYYALEEGARHQTDRDSGGTAGPRDVDIRGLIVAMPARIPWVQTYPGSGRRSSLQ